MKAACLTVQLLASKCIFSVTEDMKEKATTMAKIQAMRTFFVIGILEQFEDTLKVFETILPSYYSGVLDIWQSDSK